MQEKDDKVLWVELLCYFNLGKVPRGSYVIGHFDFFNCQNLLQNYNFNPGP